VQHWPDLMARLGGDALARSQAEADRVITAALAGHLVSRADGDGRPDAPWRLDPIPLVLDAEEFDWLAAAVRQRMAAMELLLGDLYGARRCVREGWVPAEVLAASPRYRLAMVGAPAPPRWLTSYALDVVAGADGVWRAVQDLADTPTGVGYAQLDRSVMARVATELLGPDGVGEPASIGGFPAELRHALATVSSVDSPRIVLLTSGIADPAYVEHSALAGLLGFHLVHGADLVVRSGRVWLRVLGGVEPIDVVYRRRADVELDPIEVSATAATGVPGLAFAAAEGGVVLANAHGAGVLEDPAMAPYWAQAIAGLTGETLLLPALDGAPPLATRPAFLGGRVDAAPVVVRLHAVAGPDGPRVMLGGNGRVLATGDHPRRPTARVAKDVWVLGVRPNVRLAPPLPPVDLSASVPTRVADAMYWLGRSAERAEAIARTAWAVRARDEEDPALAGLDGGRWAARMVGLLRGVSGRPTIVGSDGSADLDGALADAWEALVSALGDVVESAATIGEHLSATTGRVLRRLATARDLGEHAPIDVLDAVLTDLAALAGLWNESVVRGPAWRVGELGRRLERSLVVLTLVAASTDGSPRFDPTDLVDTAGLEVLLAANESLVAYRRRYRSDVELAPAAALLLLDAANPRSFAAAVTRLTEHVDALDWPAGRQALGELGQTVGADRPLAGVPAALQRVRAFDELVGRRWFATPVEPVLVRAGGVAPDGR
jgi:uncharacterized circularly permuted ATP-grasp superfamily protein/uncharacterized alpha-E superfamily protein